MNKMSIQQMIAERVQEKLGEGYKVSYTEMEKENGEIFKGVIIRKEGDKISPVIYFRDNKELGDIDGMADDLVDRYMESLDKNPATRTDEIFDAIGNGNMSKHKDILGVRVLNYEKNRGYLDGCVCGQFLDLAVVPILEVGGRAWTRIKSTPNLDMSDDEIIEAALENAKAKGYTTFSLVGIFYSRGGNGLRDQMCIHSTAEMTNGASVILFPDEFKERAEAMNDDLIILPSSTQEVLSIPRTGADIKECMVMVKDINATKVVPTEVLSNNVYIFSRKENKITLA